MQDIFSFFTSQPTPMPDINGLALIRRRAIIWTNADPADWRIYSALGGDELISAIPLVSWALHIAQSMAV